MDGNDPGERRCHRHRRALFVSLPQQKDVSLSLSLLPSLILSLSLSPLLSLYFSLTSWLEASRRELFIFLSLSEEGGKKKC